jgi:hypothetical protein
MTPCSSRILEPYPKSHLTDQTETKPAMITTLCSQPCQGITTMPIIHRLPQICLQTTHLLERDPGLRGECLFGILQLDPS